MIYLDNSATTRYKPKSVIDCYYREATNSANSGRSGHSDAIALMTKIYKAREVIKEYVGANDDYEVIFTSGATEGLNIAIQGYLKGKEGDVITTMLEHNSVIRPLHYISQNQNININYIKPNEIGQVTSDMVREKITSDTKLIVINHTSNVIGVTQDIASIGIVAREYNIPLLIDTAQSLGHTKINMVSDNISILVGCGHKGLQAMQGIGFIVIKKDILLSPIKFGGTGTNSDSLEQPTLYPEGFECGTLNSPAIVSLIPAIEWLNEHQSQLERKEKLLSGELIYGLKQINHVKLYSSYPSSVISFNIDSFSSSEIADILSENNIAVRGGLHCAPLAHKYLNTFDIGTVRASIGFNNSMYDIKKLLEVVENIAKSI